MINLQAAVACRYVFVISGNSDFYNKFGYSITQFKALSNKDKLKHLLNKLGQIPGLKPKTLPRGNFDQIVSAYPAISYHPHVSSEGVELHFELQPLSKGIRIRADRSTGKAAGAVLVSSITGRCLWVKRSDQGDAPNLWACLGGGVDKGETIIEGLRRELYEEGGITMPIPFIPVYKSVQDNGAFAYYNFVGLVGNEFEPKLNDEHTDFVWSATPPTPLHPKLEEALRQPRYQTTLSKYRKQMARVNAAVEAPVAVFNIKNPDILELASANDGKTWHKRDDRDKFVFLNKCANMGGTGVTLKLGNNSFRDKVDFNTVYKKPNAKFTFEIGKRRGYTAVIVKVQA